LAAGAGPAAFPFDFQTPAPARGAVRPTAGCGGMHNSFNPSNEMAFIFGLLQKHFFFRLRKQPEAAIPCFRNRVFNI
jgi:hypothetical protein